MPTGTTLELSKEWIYEQHVTLGKSCRKIAAELGCDKKCISQRLKDFDIKCLSKPGMPISKLVGKKFDMLLVISYEGRDKTGKNHTWKCICDCGKETTVIQKSLTTRHTTSCGCKRYRRPARNKCVGGLMGQVWGNIFGAAKRRGFEFSITQEYAWKLFVEQGRRCALTGKTITLPNNTNEFMSRKHTASLDRIDSSKGYIDGNVQWVSKNANLIKMDFQQDEFLDTCDDISDFNKPKRIKEWQLLVMI